MRMTSYNFETRHFAISDTGIHLLRDRYNYRTIRFSEIRRMVIEKGEETPNWMGAFALGAVILYAAVDVSLPIIDSFISGYGSAGMGKILVFLALLGCAGGSFVYSALRRGVIVRITYGNGKQDRFPLRDIITAGGMDDFVFMMTSKLDSKLVVKLKRIPAPVKR